jgi:hypothetical protein
MSIPSANSFSPFDVEMFDYFKIEAEECAGRVSRVSSDEARTDLDIDWRDIAANLGGLAYHYRDPLTGRRLLSRVRLDHPQVDENGKVVAKYLSPPGDKARQHLWFPNNVSPWLKDTRVPAVIVEAEKSSMAVMSAAHRANRRLLVIACGGCMGWRGRIGKRLAKDGSNQDLHGPLSDFDLVDWQNRVAIILFDTNARNNPYVRRAERQLAMFLAGQGAEVHIGKLWLLWSKRGIQ